MKTEYFYWKHNPMRVEKILTECTEEVVRDIRNHFKSCEQKKGTKYFIEYRFNGIQYKKKIFVPKDETADVEQIKKELTLSMLEEVANDYTIGYWNVEEYYK